MDNLLADTMRRIHRDVYRETVNGMLAVLEGVFAPKCRCGAMKTLRADLDEFERNACSAIGGLPADKVGVFCTKDDSFNAGIAQGRERLLAVVEWATGRGCGLSSETMLRASFGLPVSGHIPWDVSDFGRCYGMLRALPWVRESFPAIAKLSPAWADYIENWAALEAAYESEQDQRNCHKTWAIIQGIVARHDARRTP